MEPRGLETRACFPPDKLSFLCRTDVGWSIVVAHFVALREERRTGEGRSMAGGRERERERREEHSNSIGIE